MALDIDRTDSVIVATRATRCSHLKVLLCHLDSVVVGVLVLGELEDDLGPHILQLLQTNLHLLLLLCPVHDLTHFVLELVKLKGEEVSQLEVWVVHIKGDLQGVQPQAQ